MVVQVESMHECHPAKVVDENFVLREHDDVFQVDLDADDLLAELNDHDCFFSTRVPNDELTLASPLGRSLYLRQPTHCRLPLLHGLQPVAFRVAHLIRIVQVDVLVKGIILIRVLPAAAVHGDFREDGLQDKSDDV